MEVKVIEPEREHSPDVARLLNVLRRVSPVRAQLWVEVGALPMTFWSRVPVIAPRLRYLELKISLGALKEEYASWLVSRPFPRVIEHRMN